MKIKVVLEFDEEKMGKGWMNEYVFDLLLYGDTATRRDLLKVNTYEEMI